MRRHDPEDQENGFHQLRPYAAELVDELMSAFDVETDYGLRCWLLELIGEARSPGSLPLLVTQLNNSDPALRYWAKRGLQLLDSRDARRALHDADPDGTSP
jgi:hypothetical protein